MFGFSIREILPHVYHLHFESAYDLAMHFLRYQEYYESPKWYCRIFSLVDYMEWYAKEHGKGAFTYPKDWSGFNVPSWVVWQVNDAVLPDPNPYDDFMRSITRMVCREEGNHPFYLIGTSGESRNDTESEVEVLAHEIAHALYTVDAKYSQAVNQLLEDWRLGLGGHKRAELGSAEDVLKGMGYHESTLEDEIHAYCATGLCKELKGVISKSEMKPFQKLFQEYKKQCLDGK